MVVDDPGEAARLVGSGADVVLVTAGAGHPAGTPGPGRLAVMVGDPADRRVAAAAAEMDRELFGPGATSPPRPAPA